MIDRSHALPIARQARELGISRGQSLSHDRISKLFDSSPIPTKLGELRVQVSQIG
jgi:hypothetical protein